IGLALTRLNPPDTALGSFNAVMGGLYPADNRRSVEQAADFEGLLSLKVVLQGQGLWRTGKRRHVVDAGLCLVLNQGETYSLAFRARRPGRDRRRRQPLAASLSSAVRRRVPHHARSLRDGTAPGACRPPACGYGSLGHRDLPGGGLRKPGQLLGPLPPLVRRLSGIVAQNRKIGEA